MGQWGHPLDSNMEANIEATRASMVSLAWQPGRSLIPQVGMNNQPNLLTLAPRESVLPKGEYHV